MNTRFPSEKEIVRAWHILDAENVPLGRLASRAAMLLMGKHKAIFTPFLDTGDHVIVLNASKVRLTGRKEDQKLYRRHSGYPGGLVEVAAKKVRATRRPSWSKRPSRACCPRPNSASTCSGYCAFTRVTSIRTRRRSRWR